MELEVGPETQLHVQGRVNVSLPRFMTRLAPDQLKAAAAAEQRAQMVLACGYDGEDIVLLTGDGCLKKLRPEEHGLPTEQCIPIDHGHGVLFPQAVTGNNTSFEAAALFMVERSQRINVQFGGEPTYDGNEGKAGRPEEDDPRGG